jgi:hypothetical protein
MWQGPSAKQGDKSEKVSGRTKTELFSSLISFIVIVGWAFRPWALPTSPGFFQATFIF